MTRANARHPTRRTAVQSLASIAAIAPGAILSSVCAVAADPDLETATSLRFYAEHSGIAFGCAGAAPNVQPDRALLQKFSSEAKIFAPEGALKWDMTEPEPGQFDFDQADSIATFAADNGMVMYGHTLVWYAAIPYWVAALSTATDATRALEHHISTLVPRYRGRIWAWDVVNEPIEPTDGLDHGYRNSVWYRCLGIDYIDRAFRLAREADPNVPLCLSEYGIEYATPRNRLRRTALLDLLQSLRDRGTPVDCLALQSHLDAGEILDRRELKNFLDAVVRLGFTLCITELDVNDFYLRGTEAERDSAVARHLAEYLDIVFSVARPAWITCWGLSDRYTWLRQYYKRRDGSALRPLPLDSALYRKPMWAVLAQYLKN